MNSLAVPGGLDISTDLSTAVQMTRDSSQSAAASSSVSSHSSSSFSPSSASLKGQSPPCLEPARSPKPSSFKSSSAAQEPAFRIEKRKANTLAARRYRQKRVDQMSTLEAELKEVKAERDALKVRNARLEGEVETLRALLRSQK